MNERWLLGLDAEWNPWITTAPWAAKAGAASLYATVIHRYPMKLDRVNLRTTFSLGASTLLFDVYGAPKYDIGPFVGFSPLGIDYDLGNSVRLVFDPLGVEVPGAAHRPHPAVLRAVPHDDRNPDRRVSRRLTEVLGQRLPVVRGPARGEVLLLARPESRSDRGRPSFRCPPRVSVNRTSEYTPGSHIFTRHAWTTRVAGHELDVATVDRAAEQRERAAFGVAISAARPPVASVNCALVVSAA